MGASWNKLALYAGKQKTEVRILMCGLDAAGIDLILSLIVLFSFIVQVKRQLSTS
jgi:hypothetical protein